jgi:hypothetical protein
LQTKKSDNAFEAITRAHRLRREGGAVAYEIVPMSEQKRGSA